MKQGRAIASEGWLAEHPSWKIIAYRPSIARGCGCQKKGAFVNLGAYYLWGIPAGVVLAFVYHLGGKGLWLGIILAHSAQALIYLVVILLTDWDKQAMKAAERVTQESAA
ncbi:protein DETOXIFICATION 17-like [Nicotiana tabacum]|uniref:Protein DETOXIFICATION 17-like n=1 Tax=Nicotiana tabacum TaxID=4097 RepID=A0AC58S085_TOBAC